jgi:hypothetical protein
MSLPPAVTLSRTTPCTLSRGDLVDEQLRDVVVVGRIPEPQLLGEFGGPGVNSSTAPAATRFGQRPCTPDLRGGKILAGGPGRLVDLCVVKHDDGGVSTELELHPPEQGCRELRDLKAATAAVSFRHWANLIHDLGDAQSGAGIRQPLLAGRRTRCHWYARRATADALSAG